MDRYFGSSQAAKNSTVNSTSPSPIVVLFELFTRLVIPLCSRMKDRPNVGTPIVASCNLIDITGVGLMQFIGLRGYLGDSSALATARYPETLGSIFVGHLVLAQNDPAITISQVIGAPSYMELIFSFVRTWYASSLHLRLPDPKSHGVVGSTPSPERKLPYSPSTAPKPSSVCRSTSTRIISQRRTAVISLGTMVRSRRWMRRSNSAWVTVSKGGQRGRRGWRETILWQWESQRMEGGDVQSSGM